VIEVLYELLYRYKNEPGLGRTVFQDLYEENYLPAIILQNQYSYHLHFTLGSQIIVARYKILEHLMVLIDLSHRDY